MEKKIEFDRGFVNSWDIKDKEDIHPSHRTEVVEVGALEQTRNATIDNEVLPMIKELHERLQKEERLTDKVDTYLTELIIDIGKLKERSN